MFRHLTISKLGKITFAILLMAFSIVGSAGTMRCFFGLPVEEVAVTAPVEQADCCPSTKAAPKPEKPRCCCIDALEQSIVEVNKANPVVFQIDFPILESEVPEFNLDQTIIPFEQIRWPEVHGPPGIALSPVSPRAPPVA